MLRQSLQSVLWQSYRSLEVIVSDNASDTDTVAVVDSFGDDRVRVDRLDTNIGLHGNLSRCLHLGTGTYRMMLPDDDLMLPGNVESKVAFFQAHPQVGLVHSAFRYVNSDSLPYGPVTNWTSAEKDVVQPGHEYISESIAKGGITCVSSVMLRSDIVGSESFVADDGPYCDLALWLRLAQRADVGFLTAPLSGYRVHASSASSGFQTVKQVRGRVILTQHHADAVKLAFGRFVENADLDPEFASCGTRGCSTPVTARCGWRSGSTVTFRPRCSSWRRGRWAGPSAAGCITRCRSTRTHPNRLTTALPPP